MTRADFEWFDAESGRVTLALPAAAVADCAHAGKCDDDVAFWHRHEATAAQLRGIGRIDLEIVLRRYGAWSVDELQSTPRATLEQRILKIAFEKSFPELRVGLIHGRIKAREREQIMTSFKAGDLDLLVCTTVIEVGVDVPNATLMLIIHAERFGLSQLHQLRGRVGRGSHRSCCVLVGYEPGGEDAKRRLDIMVNSNDGFTIAEEDLDIRGPGEFFGTRQSGLPDSG